MEIKRLCREFHLYILWVSAEVKQVFAGKLLESEEGEQEGGIHGKKSNRPDEEADALTDKEGSLADELPLELGSQGAEGFVSKAS